MYFVDVGNNKRQQMLDLKSNPFAKGCELDDALGLYVTVTLPHAPVMINRVVCVLFDLAVH